MPRPPREPFPDSTIGFALDPYGYIARRCRRHRSDVFETRLLLRRTLCMTGPEAAAVFYDGSRFEREGAAPARLQKTLFGRGGVQGLDGRAHRVRKAMFLDVAGPANARSIGEIFLRHWDASAERWASSGRIVLSDELHPLLTRTACEWAGVALPEPRVGPLGERLRAMYDAAGDVGPRHRRARNARAQAEGWLSGLVTRTRQGRGGMRPGSPAEAVALHSDGNDGPPPERVAAVEVLNLLRPTVAVAVYITHLAHALNEHPGHRERVANDPDHAAMFVQEVRRFYPFFPAAAAVVRDTFDWQGVRFERGLRALLDLHGTNRDPRCWEDPGSFRPERFRGWPGDPFTLIPQGGGDHAAGHRCAGEWITVELMVAALDALTRRTEYRVPDQDLRLNTRRLPALPRDGFLIDRIRRRAAPDRARPDPPVVTVPGACPAAHGRSGGRVPSR